MHQNQSGLYTTNSLSSHASLLLSASPTIITSPLQNNTNNPQNSSTPSSIALARRQPSTILLAASNVDNDSLNNDSSTVISSNEDYINFKKPQNEIFKKLDGKIQKIVAAHSNLNKLYALNDFSSLGVGPKRPFELPPQLPRPPPCVPKVSGEPGTQWDEEPVNPLVTGDAMPRVEFNAAKPNTSMLDPRHRLKSPIKHNFSGAGNKPQTNKVIGLTLHSAINKLHQMKRRQEQQQQQPPLIRKPPQSNQNKTLNSSKVPQVHAACSSSSTNNLSTPTISPAHFSILAQRIKETLETECATKTQKGSLSDEDKKKFQQDLIALLKKEIYDVTKSSLKFKQNFSSPESKPKVNEQRSLLLKSSPQTLYNTIRRETSILLNKRQQQQQQQNPQLGRSNLSLLSDQKNLDRQSVNIQRVLSRQPYDKQTIRVIVPPIELGSGLKFNNYLEKEPPQPTTNMISVEQFAKCLNLVRSNDASLQKHQEHLLQSETKWRMHVSTRPLRLRRIRGERIHMPASASYKATRKAGLQ